MPIVTLRFRLVAHRLLSLLVLSCLMAPLLAPMPVAAAPSVHIVRVKANGNFVNSGNSWAEATSLSGALAHSVPGDEIWVAAGIYIPNTIESSFVLTNEVALYGGFAGTESSLDQRNPTLHVTVLSGDMDNDDNKDASGVITNTNAIVGSNAYHIVMATGTQNDPLDSSAVLDGFTITGGDAFGSDSNPCYSCGGGLVLVYGSPTLANLVFSGNRAGVGGGGMHLFISSPQMSAITFTGNEAGSDGGGMYLAGSSPSMTNVTFNDNQADTYGGGMYNEGGSPILTAVTFSGNNADYGGGMYQLSSSSTLSNVTFSRNHADRVGGGLYNDESSSTLTTVTFSRNNADYGGGMNEYSGSSTLTNVTFSGNRAVNTGGGMYIDYNSSPTLINVTFSGNYADSRGGGMLNDRNSSPVLTNVTFSGNDSFSNGSGIYNYSSNPILQNTIVWGNASGSVDNNDASLPSYRYSLVEGINPSGTGNLDGANPTNKPRFVRDVNCHTGGCTDDPGTPPVDESADDDYGDLRLLPASPVIDAGDNNANLDAAEPVTTTIADIETDLASQPRIVAVKSLPATVDMGAYEAVASAPAADAGDPYSTDEGGEIALNGAASSDDFGIVTYAWDCTNNGSIDASAVSPTGSKCTFPNSGSFILRLIVTDSVNLTATATAIVTVVNVAPDFTPGSNQSTFAGSAKSFALGSFADPGDEGSWPVTVDWGDNSTNSQFSVDHAGDLPNKGHTYATPGSYSVVVTVKDGDANDHDGFQVTVNPLPPGAPNVTAPADQTATAGIDHSFALGSFVDPGSNGPWQISVNWGDSPTPTPFSAGSSGNLPAKPHTYAAAGAYDVIVTVSDGALSASAGFRVTASAESDAGSVTGVVFADANANGAQESGEKGVSGAKMTLKTAGEASAADAQLTRTTTSDANGHYRFDNVPAGDYTLTLTPPSGFATSGASQAAVSVQSGETTTAPTFALEADEGGSEGSIFLPNVKRP